MDNVIRAIAAYERTLLSRRLAPSTATCSPAIIGALSERQKAGMQLFFSERTGCAGCHGGINFNGEWVDREHPEANADIRRHRHGRGGARAHAAQPSRDRALSCTTAGSPTLDAVLDHYERLATDPAADTRLRRAPLTTVELRATAGIPALARRKALSPATRSRNRVCLRASMNLDTTFGRHLLLPHPTSEPGAQAGPGARPVGCRCAPAARIASSSPIASPGISTRCGLPEPRSAVRTDGLWRHTCFEAFIGTRRRRRLLGIQLFAVGRLGCLSLLRISRRHGAAAEGRATRHRSAIRAVRPSSSRYRSTCRG